MDSLDSETWRWYAAKLAYNYEWKACNHAMEKCLELNPNFAEAYAFYAHFLMMQNKWDMAWSQIRKALDLDPFNPLVLYFHSVMLLHTGKYDKLDVTFISGWTQFLIYSQKNKYDSAMIGLKKHMQTIGQYNAAKQLDSIFHETNDFKYTLNVVADSLAALSYTTFVPAASIFSIYLNAENTEQSFVWLEKLYIRKDPNLPYFTIHGPLNKDWFINHPRYKEIIKKINLLE